MEYPTLEEVETASRDQLAKWRRYLPSPGWDAAGDPKFEVVLEAQTATLNRIIERFDDLGGMTPGISKRIDREMEGGGK